MNAPLQLFLETSSVGSIGKLVFDCPDEKVNTLSSSLMKEFEEVIQSLSQRNDLKALLITSKKPSVFLAGADLREFPLALKNPQLLEDLVKRGHRIFSKLQSLPFPTIAVIDGVCLGGGLELALACSYRIATDNPKTVFALPETTLGVFPAWGGTQRLPRLVGLATGLDMILTGKKINAKQAWKIHLIDAVIPSTYMDEYTQEFLFQIFNNKEKKKILSRRKELGFQQIILEKNFLGRKFLFKKVKEKLLAKTKGHYVAPEVALKLIEDTCTLPLAEGLEKELQTALNSSNTGFSQALNLIDLYFIQENLKKDPQGVSEEIVPSLIQSASVIGAGLMGSFISWLFANNDIDVRMKDLNWELLGRGNGQIYALFQAALKHKKLTPDQLSLKFHHLSYCTDYSGFNRVDLILEAAVENLTIKQDLFKEVEQVASEKAIIATNTSSLTISELSQNLQHPERFIGMHFFNPVNKMPLVEIIPGPKTSPLNLATIIHFCKKIGKTPLVVGDCHGFLVNRILACGLNEAVWMLQEGISMQKIEKVFDEFGMPMSPFKLSDEIGIDVCYKSSKTFEKAYGERMRSPDILQIMNDQELYGKKNGKGFYVYSGKQSKENEDIKTIVSALPEKNKKLDETTIRDRFILNMVNEATRCLEENVVSSPAYLDLALILGAGFPPFRGGLMKFADWLGRDYIKSRLLEFEKTYGVRFTPSNYIMNSSPSSPPSVPAYK